MVHITFWLQSVLSVFFLACYVVSISGTWRLFYATRIIGGLIALLFWSFEIARGLLPSDISRFSNRIKYQIIQDVLRKKLKLFKMLSVAAENNAYRNKVILQVVSGSHAEKLFQKDAS